jgi:hypothetical protein
MGIAPASWRAKPHASAYGISAMAIRVIGRSYFPASFTLATVPEVDGDAATGFSARPRLATQLRRQTSAHELTTGDFTHPARGFLNEMVVS